MLPPVWAKSVSAAQQARRSCEDVRCIETCTLLDSALQPVRKDLFRSIERYVGLNALCRTSGHHRLPFWHDIMSSMQLVGIAAIVLLIIYKVFVKPLFSPLRHLPSPSQGPAYKRLLIEPSVDQLARWCHEIPNEGFIRYHGILNTQKVLVTDPTAVHDIFSTQPYSFIKPPPISKIIRSILGEGIIVVEGDAHKSQKKALQPAFKVRNVKDFYPVLKRKTEELVSTLSTTMKSQADHGDSSAIDLGSRLNVRMQCTVREAC
jgi:hypothetical protein